MLHVGCLAVLSSSRLLSVFLKILELKVITLAIEMCWGKRRKVGKVKAGIMEGIFSIIYAAISIKFVCVVKSR